MEAIFFALLTYIGWGSGDIFQTLVSRKIGGYSTAFWFYIFDLIIFALLIPVYFSELSEFSSAVLLLTFILSFFGAIPLVCYYESVRRGNAALNTTISASFSSVTVVLSILFLGEKISVLQGVSICIILLGIILSMFDFKQFGEKKIISDKGILFAVIAMMTWGIYYTFIKIPVKEVGWFWPTYIADIGFLPIFLYMKLNSIPIRVPKGFHEFLLICIGASLIGIAAFTFNIALGKGLASVVAPIASSAPTLYAILAFFVFKDPITKQQIWGIIITLSGIVLLSFSSI